MKRSTFLTRNQWMGILLIICLLIGIFVGLHYLPKTETTAPDQPQQDTLAQTISTNKRAYYDSLYTAKTKYYDSLRLVRRDSLHRAYQAHQDSVHTVDSLWWDSVYSATPRVVKKDTILDLNSADTTSLKLIRGIGSSMAQRIVRYRQRLGGFTSARQLQDEQLYMDQYGHSIRHKYCIADSVLSCFTVCLDSVKAIPVNQASIQQLQAHPYITHTLAKEIYQTRRTKTRYKTLDEIHQLPHMNDSLWQQLRPYLQINDNQ